MKIPIDPRDFYDIVRQRKQIKAEALANAMYDPICAGYAELLASDTLSKFIDDLADYDDYEQEEDDIRPY